MKKRHDSYLRKIAGFGAVIGVASLLSPVGSGNSLADPSGGGGPADYDLSWHTIDGGGAMRSTGDDYELSGTIGQTDAGSMQSADGEFELTGGFWFRIPLGDCEDDGDVDLNDFEAFEACLTGPDAPVVDGACRCFDVDRNNAVDLVDLAVVQANFTSQ